MNSTEIPVRLCAVDIGSNAIKMRIVEVARDGIRRTLNETRYGIRLGESFQSGLIPPETLESTAAAFVEIAALCKTSRVSHIRAVATSAMREATNGRELVALVENRAGIKINVITGKEEGHLLGWGVRPDLIKDRHNLIIDVGGGSTELVFVKPSLSVSAVRSLRLGAVRLAHMSGFAGRLGKRDVQSLKRHIEQMLDEANLPVAHKDTHVVGVAGTIRALVQACHGSESQSVLTRSDLDALLNELSGLTPAEMEARFGIERKRGQIIVPGGLIYAAVMELYNLPKLTFSPRGVRDGIVDELVETALGLGSVHHLPGDFVPIGEKYDFDSEHALHVESLALYLFDHLRNLHQLDELWRESLRAAAVLHDIGKYISYSRHHKHAYYLISNEELPGLSSAQQLHAATIARYHRRAMPLPSHPEFNLHTPEAKTGIAKCAAMLRVADALDRLHRQAVAIERVVHEERSVRLLLTSGDSLAPELPAVAKKCEMFEAVFGKRIRLEMANGD